MSEERPRKRIIYYPLEGMETSKELEEVEPRPLPTKPSRPYLFPIIGQIIELIVSILEARLELIRSRVQRPYEPTQFPRTMRREVVRDPETGRILEETFYIY